jgi:hypothetical protein
VADYSNIATSESFGLSAKPFGASDDGSFFQRKPLFFEVFKEFAANEPSDALGDDMSSWRAGAKALHPPTVCSNKN